MTKKKGDSTPAETSIEVMSGVAKKLWHSIQNPDGKDVEIFEQYSHALQRKLFHNESEFLHHFEEGYKVLMNEIAHGQKK